MYKYDVFTRAELYFSRPSQFNDPFESKPKMVGLESLKDRQKFVNSYIKRELSGKKYKEKQILKKQFLIRLSNPELVKEDLHKFLDLYGIFSTAKKWDQCLMWSHYSDSHKGFCIGFEFDEVFDDDMGVPYAVKYAKKYPIVGPDLFDRDIEGNNEKLLETTIATKSTEWLYEEEIRYIKFASKGGSGIYKFQKQKVKEVIIGACTSLENKKELIKIVKNNMPWVTIYQAVLSASKYELHKEPA